MKTMHAKFTRQELARLRMQRKAFTVGYWVVGVILLAIIFGAIK